MENSRRSSSSGPAKDMIISAKFHGRKAFAVFEEMRGNTEFCDVVVKVSNLTFHAHGLILAGISPFFRQELSGRSREEIVEFVLPEDVSPAAARSILVFIYTGELTLNLETVQDLLHVASMLQLEELVQTMVEFIVKNLSTSNCLVFLSLATKLTLDGMKRKIQRFMDCNFKQLTKSSRFSLLSAETLTCIITRKTLQVKREEVVYEAVWKWYKSDMQNRKEVAEKVFSEIQFNQISQKYLAEVIVPDLVEGQNMCTELVKQALQAFHTDAGAGQTSSCGNRRKIKEAIYIISGRSDSVERFDHVTSACVPCNEIMPNTPSGENHYAVTIGQDLYVVSTTKVEKFDVLSSSWSTVCTGVDVRDTGVCAGKDVIYVVGGRGCSNEAQKLEIQSCEWSVLPPMNNGRRCPGAAVLSSKLYAIGGYGEAEPMTSMERFDPKSEKWSMVKHLNVPRFQHGAVALDGKIFVVGGRDNEKNKDTVEVYDPKEKSWSLLEETMKEARNDFGIVAQGSLIYCVGGRGVSSVECYSLGEKEWKVVGKTGQNNFCISCVSLLPP